MHIVVHHSSFYDWQPVPSDVTVTKEDIAADRVRPAIGSDESGTLKYNMKVTKKQDTYTTIAMPELQLIQLILGDVMRNRGWHTRAQAVAQYVSRHVLPCHAHHRHVGPGPAGDTFIVEHDEPDLPLFRKMVEMHTRSEKNPSGEILPEDVAALEELYTTESSHAHHVAALHAHFRIAHPAPAASAAKKEAAK